MTKAPSPPPRLFITGATGFIGRHLLARLLASGARCAVLLRQPVEARLERLSAALASLGVDAPACLADGRLTPVAGDVKGDLPSPDALPGQVHGVVHAAACTRFTEDDAGDPLATNVGGTERLLRWMTERGVPALHLVSTAYVCGRRPHAAERVERDVPPPSFHNAYERSKWLAEAASQAWASDSPGRTLTVYRPSIVVGEHATGAATKFDGFYVSIRAAELLARAMKGRPPSAVRVKGSPDGRQNIVPVDYVAAMIAGGVMRPELHGRVYHLTNPCPPTNQAIADAAQAHFGIAGCRLVPPGQFSGAGLSALERLVRHAAAPIEHYLVDTPGFERGNARDLEAALGIACPPYDGESLARLIRYATRAWSARRDPAATASPEPPGSRSSFSEYFERFLPRAVARSRIALLAGLTVAVRFVIEDAPGAEWVCRFDRGRLAEVRRGVNGIREDFGYRTTREGFWKAVSGRAHPQELFVEGRVRIFGDVERALKMAMILNAFARECPFVPPAEEAA